MVQVLKEELRQAILREARNEFAQHGYMAASVRRIAAKVGISVGNLYRYYEGKEVIFDSVVEPVYHELEALLSNHDGQRYDEENIFELVVRVLTNIVGEIRIPLLILIDGTKGTRHEDAVLKFHQMMADNVANHLVDYNSKQGREVFDQQAAWPVSVAFMQGFFEIIRRYEDPEDCKSMVHQYVLFWYQGLRTFLL